MKDKALLLYINLFKRLIGLLYTHILEQKVLKK